jgi:hypothetical protein
VSFTLMRGCCYLAAEASSPVDARLTDDPEKAWRTPVFLEAQERADLIRNIRGMTFQIHGLR